jgi:hypothetical protein
VIDCLASVRENRAVIDRWRKFDVSRIGDWLRECQAFAGPGEQNDTAECKKASIEEELLFH